MYVLVCSQYVLVNITSTHMYPVYCMCVLLCLATCHPIRLGVYIVLAYNNKPRLGPNWTPIAFKEYLPSCVIIKTLAAL